MCSPKLAHVVATVAVIGTGLAGCINVDSNINVGGSNNTQTTGRSRPVRADDRAHYSGRTSSEQGVCREYHDHTEHCIQDVQRTSPGCDPRMFVSESVPQNYLSQSRFFACNSFEDRNGNGLWSFDEIEGGPRGTFRTDEPISLIGWELSDRKLHAKVYDSQGNKLFQQSFPGHRGGHRIRYSPHSLPAGTYTVTWERDECGQGQWNERGRQTIAVVNCSPRTKDRCAPHYNAPPISNPGIVESIK